MIKAIQTRYAGYLFRSRLEARWAVFFDALKLNWLYEPEGFEVDSGTRYLPDFKINLRKGPLWIEIKPDGVGSSSFSKFMAASPRDWRGSVFHDIPDPRAQHYGHEIWDGENGEDPNFGPFDDNYKFCICNRCGEVGFEFGGMAERIGGDCKHTYHWDEPRLSAAFAEARAARFEHEAREKYVTL